MIAALVVTGCGAGLWMLSLGIAWSAPPTWIAPRDGVVLSGAAAGLAAAVAGVVRVVVGLLGAGW